MSSLRALVLLSLVPFAAGCEQRCCFDAATGKTTVVNSLASCPNGEIDLGKVTESEAGSTERQCIERAASNGLIVEGSTCEDFCDLVQEVCDDPACVSSCEEFGDGAASEAAVSCAEDATSCQETNACFGEL